MDRRDRGEWLRRRREGGTPDPADPADPTGSARRRPGDRRGSDLPAEARPILVAVIVSFVVSLLVTPLMAPFGARLGDEVEWRGIGYVDTCHRAWRTLWTTWECTGSLEGDASGLGPLLSPRDVSGEIVEVVVRRTVESTRGRVLVTADMPTGNDGWLLWGVRSGLLIVIWGVAVTVVIRRGKRRRPA